MWGLLPISIWPSFREKVGLAEFRFILTFLVGALIVPASWLFLGSPTQPVLYKDPPNPPENRSAWALQRYHPELAVSEKGRDDS